MHVQALPPVMHLRNMNAYVATALGDWRSKQNVQAHIPTAFAGHSKQLAHAGTAEDGTVMCIVLLCRSNHLRSLQNAANIPAAAWPLPIRAGPYWAGIL